MLNCFHPKRLTMAKDEIIRQHQLKSIVKEIQKDDNLKKLVERILHIKGYQIHKEAYTFSQSEIMQVAGYIPHNFYEVDLTNFFEIFRIRSTKDACGFFYNEWQNAYDNQQCNEAIIMQLNSNEPLILTLRDVNFSEKDFERLLNADTIPYTLGKEYIMNCPIGDVSFERRMEYYGINNSSILYRDCAFIFYTYCKRVDYLSVDKMYLEKVIDRYGIKYKKVFLLNFLSQLTLKDLRGYLRIGKYFLSLTGEFGTKKFQDFFQNTDFVIQKKYRDWINILLINQYFGNDERSLFWSDFEFENVKRYTKSDAVVMEFKNVYAIEFLGESMGPIYLYDKKTFETKVQRWFRMYNNTDLRQELYHNPKLYNYRKEHRGYWQNDMRYVLWRQYGIKPSNL